MRRLRATHAALAAACLLLVVSVTAVPARANPGQEAILMDDAELVYESPASLDTTLAGIKALGVDRIRVSVYWRLIAPAPSSKNRPSFPYGAANPASYPQGTWARYDRIVERAREHGLGVLFTLTAPAPDWATGSPGRDDIEDTYEPNANDFKEFVTAVGTRYSGNYREQVAPAPQPTPPPPGLLGGGQQPAPAPPPQETGRTLPRVDAWSIWNEPNHPGWLTPQWRLDAGAAGGYAPAAPGIYRELLDGAWSALQATGHSTDTILIGETAPRGFAEKGETRGLRPLAFIRELYCADESFRGFNGSAARGRNCPASAEERQAFVSDHPVLFQASGFAHHPYAFDAPPSRSDPVGDHVVLADLSRLTSTLDTIFRSYGQSQQLPIWLTEYGYQTNPPDPYAGIPWRRQAEYLDEAEYLAYRNPRVVSTAQFLYKDDGPFRQFPASDRRYWGSFQTGLLTNGGREKPAHASYQRPIFVTPASQRRGGRLRVFGALRNAPHGATLAARVEFKAAGSSAWHTVARLTTRNERGYAQALVRATGSGRYRLAWQRPGSRRLVRSRDVRVRVR